MSRAGLSIEPTTTQMLDRIVSGKTDFGYNVLCSYTHARANTDPRIGSVMPRDYTLVMSRIAFINRHAPHPEEAKIWLDYILSRRGQAIFSLIGLHSVRSDVEGNTSAASIPLATHRLLAEHPELSGGLALQIGFGAGLVFGAQVVVLP